MTGAGNAQRQTILVLDFGAQYSQLIARRVRELNVYSELLPHNTPVDELRARRPRGLILSGGPDSVYAPQAPRLDPALFDLGIPVLGICYGMQLMAHLLGGRVVPAPEREYGPSELEVVGAPSLFRDLPARQKVWMSHGDEVMAPPSGFTISARSTHSRCAAMSDESRRIFGIQFHPEVQHTEHGLSILKRFVIDVCGSSGSWRMSSFVEEAVASIRERVGGQRVLAGLSGGVDSAVAALLIHRAIGDALSCLFIDNGLLRRREADEVV
ncbi:MAG TPA: glutamine-hydrolyzing GMP synthase, partial [Candidatus Polarisedimenticolia bacterium]